MEYISTRDPNAQGITYSGVLLEGLAPDQGLYVPENYPTLDESVLTALQGKSYVEIYTLVKSLFIGDSMTPGTQAEIAREAFTIENFPDWEEEDFAPVWRVGRNNLFIQELSGVTGAFKDMALQPVLREMEHELIAQDRRLTIVGATSGDTGVAAESAGKGRRSLEMFIMSPERGMSPFQRAQTGEQTGDNIHNISIRGSFDDCQKIVKALKQDPYFAGIGAINSINWARVASQVAYYVKGYLDVAKNVGDPVDFTVPSGNFGNVLAGYVAKQMGVPIRRLIIATNENNVLDQLTRTGIYEPRKRRITSSPSMDISTASNYERVVFDIFNGDATMVNAYMRKLAEKGSVSFAEFDVPNTAMQDLGFESGMSGKWNRTDVIRWVYETTKRKRVIDPHTADGVYVARERRDSHVPMIVLSTAIPTKFEKTVRQALGAKSVPERPERFRGLEERVAGRAGAFVLLDNSLTAVADYIRSNSRYL